ncbi:MAG: class I SAM-dependent methyltransferase [Dermatophilaceae bacterium]
MVAGIARAVSLTGSSRVIDIGSGTGHLTLELASHVCEVVAVEPSAGMNEQLRLGAARLGIDNVSIARGDSEDLDQFRADEFDAAFFAAAFHWTDRDRTLEVLDDIVRPYGAVVVISGASPVEPPAWQAAIDQVRHRFLGPERRAGSGTYTHPAERHEVVLARSAFSNVTAEMFTWSLESTVDELVGRQLSYSYSSPILLAEDLPRYEESLHTALSEFATDGRLSEQLHSETLIARRPRPER